MTSENSEHIYIKEGDYVIVKSGTNLRLVELRKNKPHYLGKRKADLFSVVGHLYGSYFQILTSGVLKKVTQSEMEIAASDFEGNVHVKDATVSDCEAKDNRSLVDTGESQKLTTGDIESYKAQGLSGQEMVKIIVANSSSFQEKTAFSKEKYLRKKQQKYIVFVQVLKPNARLLVEMYYSQGPLKICNLRIDSLSQMLTFCNVMVGGKYMITETVLGLLTASVLERIGSQGCVIQLHQGPFSIHTSQQAIRALNIPSNQLESVLHNIDVKGAMSVLQNENNVLEDMIIDYVENDVPHLVERKKCDKKEHVQKVKEILAKKDMDSLIVAVKNHPSNILPLLDFLAWSRPFAIFSMYQEPLVDCYVTLKSRGDIILLNITETWFRRYQVLKGRTHPLYSMSGHGGFLLTGVKVQKKPDKN